MSPERSLETAFSGKPAKCSLTLLELREELNLDSNRLSHVAAICATRMDGLAR
jgi:hypothetical protein